jgi:hypothetical protein
MGYCRPRISGARTLVTRNQCFLARYKLPKPKTANSRLAFLTSPRKAYLDESEDPLDHQECVFSLDPDFRLGTVPGLVAIAQWPVMTALLVRKVFRSGCMFTHHLALPGIGRVTPNAGFLPMQIESISRIIDEFRN